MQKKSSKNTSHVNLKPSIDLIPYSPTQEIISGDLVGKAIMECLINNDPEGVMEAIQIYLNALEKTQFIEQSNVPKSTLYHSLRSKNPTIKTLAKIMHATAVQSAKNTKN